MKPYKIEFYVYAESEDKAIQLQNVMNDFVRNKYQNGILVTADKMIGALSKFGNNMIVNQFLK